MTWLPDGLWQGRPSDSLGLPHFAIRGVSAWVLFNSRGFSHWLSDLPPSHPADQHAEALVTAPGQAAHLVGLLSGRFSPA